MSEISPEKEVNGSNGYLHLLLNFSLIGLTIYLITQGSLWAIASGVLWLGHLPVFDHRSEHEPRTHPLWNLYRHAEKNGFFWLNPFLSKKKVSLKARNFDSERVKVNDKLGNPILISAILVWR